MSDITDADFDVLTKLLDPLGWQILEQCFNLASFRGDTVANAAKVGEFLSAVTTRVKTKLNNYTRLIFRSLV